jgi:hypothetical protein
MATTLVEARAKATTLPRRAAVAPAAGAAEWESAKFISETQTSEKEREEEDDDKWRKRKPGSSSDDVKDENKKIQRKTRASQTSLYQLTFSSLSLASLLFLL